jgi:pimeloyl-ACP methyl ester carboxylesterase
MPLYEQGNVRIHYLEAGSGFPLMVIPGGGLNSTVAGLASHPFNPMDEFKAEYRVIAADLRNANGGQSSGPLEVGRPWDAYTDDHIGLMDHLGIREFMVLGLLHRRPVYLEPDQALRRTRCRRGACAAFRFSPDDA